MRLKKDCEVGLYTFGCRLNFAETEKLKEILIKNEFNVNYRNPCLIIIRACAITQKAENEARAKVRSLKRKNKRIKIILTGCLRNDVNCPQADLIFHKNKENKLLKEIIKIVPTNKKNKQETNEEKLRTRSFIKIQDGCNNFCSYCLIPFLRGREKSFSVDGIIKEIKEKIKKGYQEVVLTGVNIGRWHQAKRNLAWLIKKILKETTINRLRISSLWPDEINRQFINLFKNPRLGRHLHLSFQSFSSTVLVRMKRYYDLSLIQEKIKIIKKEIPDLTLTADIIVGFPGETEKEFQETFKKIKKSHLSSLHVFRYSVRPGTTAARMNNQIETRIKKIRSKKIIKLSDTLSQKWRSKFLGKKQNVLFENQKNNFWQGFTNNYLKVFVKSDKNLTNKILVVKLIKIYQDGFLGKLVV